MHGAVLDYVAKHAPREPLDVLDVGGRDINGNPRHLFHREGTWISVDLAEGPGVDLVGDITELGLVDFADVVLCLEVLEHAENWVGVVQACVEACRHGGLVIVTCAGPGREPHSAVDGGGVRPGEWYRNISADDLEDVLFVAGVDAIAESCGEDTRAVGRKL